MTLKSLEDAFLEELRDLLHAEKQIAKALPRMAKKCETTELAEAMEAHRQQTEEQITRLEKVFELLEKKPRAKRCQGVEGILEEGKEIMREDAAPEVLEAMMIGSAQKIEHYEIAGYGTACTWAEQLGCDQKVIKLLKQTLAEEKQQDELLTRIAEQAINEQAV